MKIHNFLFALLIGLSMSSNGVAAARIAGKTAYDMFPDKTLATFVSAVSDGDYHEADKLLTTGLDINAIGNDGMSPLLWVMIATLNTPKIEYLLKNGANPNYRIEKRQASALSLAAGGDRSDILELLLKYKADPNLLGPRDETMLMVAIGQFRDKNIELLLKYGADINFIDRRKETVANKAAGYGRFDWIVFFLEQGLTYNLQDLAKDVEIRQVPADSDQQRWKNKVLEMLKERGVKLPAFTPCYPRTDPRRKEEYCK